MPDFKHELLKLASYATPEPAPDIAAACGILDSHVTKILKKQSELGLRLEELYETVDENAKATSEVQSERARLMNALIAACDAVEDFYL